VPSTTETNIKKPLEEIKEVPEEDEKPKKDSMK
jgi:hypothetical protein